MARTKHHGKQQLKKRFGDKWWWWSMSTPSWWIHETMTKPQRAQTRKLLTKLKHLEDLEDAPLFPLAKKPHIYFWASIEI